jgi:hypothetical protein
MYRQAHHQPQMPQQQAPPVQPSNLGMRVAGDQNQNHAPRVTQTGLGYGSPAKAGAPADNLSYSSKQSTVVYNSSTQDPAVHESASRKIGSIADYDPLNHNYGSIATAGYRNEQQFHSYYVASAQQQQPQLQHQQQFVAQQHQPGLGLAASQPQVQQMRTTPYNFRAIYDYTAMDTDEVGFMDGDVIVNCVPIDEGWMTGTVQRTGQRGMLPANYVEPIRL